jgi:hypothetical protein
LSQHVSTFSYSLCLSLPLSVSLSLSLFLSPSLSLYLFIQSISFPSYLLVFLSVYFQFPFSLLEHIYLLYQSSLSLSLCIRSFIFPYSHIGHSTYPIPSSSLSLSPPLSISLCNMSLKKTVPQIYRDCLRLVDHIAGRSKKGDNMRNMIRMQFNMNKYEKNEQKIEEMKQK